MTRIARVSLVLGALAGAGLLLPGSATPQDAARGGEPLGKITDREGTAARRGLMEPRWSAADPRTPVLPGDWLKVGARGANALAVALDEGALVLGPGALLEVLEPARLRLHAGEVEVTPGEGKTLVVEGGPGVAPREVTARTVLRGEQGALQALAQDPRWLTGYAERAPTEAVGALLATVDGRDVPLTLGYHKVVVDIRDQFARTEIEESFVNHTSQVLEGVFYFPLPADASISGFSMWIGDEQVHGEIVEKQRARAIYETILREKRDPGLLEWAGGSLFKARVYPIGAEKRIKITYTQVLPRTVAADGASEVVYHHALASEHLRLNPLEELAVTVTVSSQRRIEAVSVPTHTARVQATDHAARVEVHAQEVAPERDLEVRIRTVRPAAHMTLSAHRRGDDGYFVLLLDAPPLARPEQQGPLDLLILADTSGSVSGPARAAQVEFVAALLDALGPEDTFDLAVFDADLRWAHGRATDPTPAAREEALGLLEGRAPLGWTDLDRALAGAAERAGARTHVIYVGDGGPTTGDADAAAFARRAPTLYEGRGSFHAVVPGSAREDAALKAIAALGGGSVRALGADDPARAAFDLLADLTAPAARDVELSFDGLAVAAVYPQDLPDMRAGTQQVIVGRWDPTTAPKDGLKGRLRFSSTLDVAGVPTRFEATHDVALGEAPAGEDDASFIPRLWARAHLDHLLAQGASKAIKDDVVALSEDFQIITPYTSFLVLETDADRERFQVQKRTRMRDGEEFFARGRDEAEHALRRQAALQARAWRRALRAQALEALADMNRGLVQRLGAIESDVLVGYAAAGRQAAANMPVGKAMADAPTTTETASAGEPQADGFEGGDADDVMGEPELPSEELAEEDEERQAAPPSASAPMPRQSREASRAEAEGRAGGGSWQRHAGVSDALDARGYRAQPGSPFDGLLPPLAAAPGEAPARDWPQALTAALTGADLRARLTAANLRVRTSVERPDGRGRLRPVGDGLWLLSPERWAVAGVHREGQDLRLDWLAHAGAGGALQRGALTAAWALGRVREAQARDAHGWGAPWPWWSREDYAPYAAWTLTSAPADVRADDGALELTFAPPDGAAGRLIVVADPTRRVVRSVRYQADADTTTWSVVFDVAEAHGAWWPTAMRRFQGDRLVESTKIAVEPLASAAFEQALAEVLAVRGDALLLGPAPTSLRAARLAVKEGKATLEERWLLLGALAGAQRWDAARPHLDAVVAAARGKRGAVALEATALLSSRRLEGLRLLLRGEADALSKTPRAADAAAAAHLLGWGNALADGAERLDLVTRLAPVATRRPALEQVRWTFDLTHAQALEQVGRPDEALTALREAVARDPERFEPHRHLAWWLANHGDPDAAVAHLDEALARHGPWPEDERQRLVNEVQGVLWSGQRFEALVERFERLEQADPQGTAHALDTYLSALVMLDRPEAAWERVKAWTALDGGLPLEGLARARFDVAVLHALGQGPGSSRGELDDARARHLADVVRALAATDPARLATALPLARRVVQDWRWNQRPAGRALVSEWMARLRAEAATLPPPSLVALFELLRHAGPAAAAEPKVWDELLDALEARLPALETSDPAGARALDRLLLSYGDPARRLRRLRDLQARAVGTPEARQQTVALLRAIFAQPWTAELRDEAAGHLPSLTPSPDEAEPARAASTTTLVQLLHQLVDWTTHARAAAEVAARPDHGQLDRRRLAVAGDEALRDARVEALELLAALDVALPAQADWLRLERAWLQVKLGRDREQARASCLALLEARLGAAPAFGDGVLLPRAMATLLYLLGTDEPQARATHAPALAAQLARARAANDARADWRQVELTLLLLCDDLAGLEAALRGWLEEADADAARWGVPLANVLAEGDRLQEAVEVLARVEADDEATHADLQRLALWHTALDRPAEARAAQARAWALVDEWELASALEQDLARVSRTGDGVPEELPAETPVKLVVLLRKAQAPAQHLWTVTRLYQTTRDFRLLEGLAEGVLGHSAQRVYPLLLALRQVTSSLQEEATLDRLRGALAALRARPDASPVDQRALHLLELLATHEAAAQRQGAGPHLDAATRALREAFALAEAREGAWAPGEPALYAMLLADLGALPGSLGQEQVKQLQALVRLGADADERLQLTRHLATCLAAHGRQEEATRALSGAIEAARGEEGLLAPRHHQHLAALAGLLQGEGRFVDAERLYQHELAPPSGARHGLGAARGLRLSLHGVRRDALAARAETSLGGGQALYAGARDALLADVAERATEAHAAALVNALVSLWNTAAQRRVPGVGDDVTRFAFSELPHVLRAYQHRQAAQLVGPVVDALARHVNAGTALDALVQQAEVEPRWLRLQGAHAWAQHAWRFGGLLHDAGGRLPAPLTARLLDLVKRELATDLRLGRSGPPICWAAWSDQFWTAQVEAFVGVAREALVERREEEGTIVHVARYLHDALRRPADGITALVDAERRGALGWDSRLLLGRWLQEAERHAEALPLLERLASERPDVLEVRRRLILALFHTEQPRRVERALADAEAYLRETKAWSEGAAATLGALCVQVERPQDAARHLDEAIALHTRARADRGVGGGTLSHYYGQLAAARLQLGDTAGAVDAACGAVVSWGRHVSQRQQALEQLAGVLQGAPDLDAYVAGLEQEVARTGLENPTLRRALGLVYVRLERPAAAEAHLRRALEAQPDDLPTQRALIEVLDALKRPAEAADQVQALAGAAGHDVSLYVQLGDRRQRLGQPGEAERAWTQAVELVPHEAEGHTALAQVRERQGRFAEAAERWRQVVRVRTDEPAGWLGLAGALLRAGDEAAAAEVARQVLGRTWEGRFGDVHAAAREVLEAASR